MGDAADDVYDAAQRRDEQRIEMKSMLVAQCEAEPSRIATNLGTILTIRPCWWMLNEESCVLYCTTCGKETDPF